MQARSHSSLPSIIFDRHYYAPPAPAISSMSTAVRHTTCSQCGRCLKHFPHRSASFCIVGRLTVHRVRNRQGWDSLLTTYSLLTPHQVSNIVRPGQARRGQARSGCETSYTTARSNNPHPPPQFAALYIAKGKGRSVNVRGGPRSPFVGSDANANANDDSISSLNSEPSRSCSLPVEDDEQAVHTVRHGFSAWGATVHLEVRTFSQTSQRFG